MSPDSNSPSLSSPPSTLLMYIDVTNIFESARIYSGLTKNYRDGVSDTPCRIILRRMISIARAKRELLVCKLYTSQDKEFGDLGPHVEVKRFRRSLRTNKEKQVDTTLTADAVEDIILKKDLAGPNPTLILFSGDKDLTPVLNKALEHGYKVELWAFNFSLNLDIKAKSASEEKLKNFPIEDIFEKVAFVAFECKKKYTPPVDRSLVATIPIPPWNNGLGSYQDRREILKEFVKKSSQIFRLPFIGKFLNDDDDYNDNSDYERILLIETVKCRQPTLCQQCQSHVTPQTSYFENAHSYIQLLEKELEQYQAKIQTYNDYRACPYSTPTNMSKANRFQLLNADENHDIIRETSHTIDNPDSSNDGGPSINLNWRAEAQSRQNFDDGEGAWVEVKSRNKLVNRPMKDNYIVSCTFKFWCSNPSCKLEHSKEELAYFKSLKNPNLRGRYKTEACAHFNRGNCSRTLCGFSHGPEDVLCYSCKTKQLGWHLRKDCPHKNF